MQPDRQPVTGRVDAARRVEVGGVDAEVDVGRQCAEPDQAVASLDVFLHLRPAQRARVDADEAGVPLVDRRLVEERDRRRDAGAVDEAHRRFDQIEAGQLDAEDDHRLPGVRDPRRRLGQGGRQRPRVARFGRRGERRHAGHPAVDDVTRQLDVPRALQPPDGIEDAVDLAQRVLRRVEDGRGGRQLLKHLVLRVVGAHLVVDQRVAPPLAETRRAADDEDRRLFGVRLPRRVRHLQPADAVGDADGAQTPQSGVGVGGEARALLVAGGDQGQRRFLQVLHEAEDEIPRHAEDVLDAERHEPLDQVVADAHHAGLIAVRRHALYLL